MSNGEPTPALHRHEHSDVSAGAILFVGATIIVSAIVMHVSLYYVQKFFNESAAGGSVEWNPLSRGPDQESLNQRLSELPAPRLEGLRQLAASPPSYRSSQPADGSPMEPRVDRRPGDQPLLRSYAWVDRDRRIARIPVDVAMQAALEMKLYPVQVGPQEAAEGAQTKEGKHAR